MLDKSKLKKLKLIVFDLDGTLLSDNNQIGKESVQLIKELGVMGVKFSFATGRIHSAITEHADTLNLHTPLISLDGSLIKTHPEAKIIFESYVPARYIKKAIKYADELLLKIALCHPEAIYYTETNSSIPSLLDKFGAKYIHVNSYENLVNRTLEVVVAGDMKKAVRLFHSRMMFPYSFGLNTSYYKSHSRGDLYYVEARKAGTNKGTGLKRLAKYLKININETAVMGDWYNDRHLFSTGALAVAVQNAVSEIKYHSSFITKRTNNEDAAAEFLEMVYKAKKTS
ncbi:MAG: HAD family hydrolase [Bacteroidetes bacterium]|nr:HAD family hydrolase [Bacteroidota bacterium]